MPRSYQVSMVRGPHDSHAPGPWSLKDRSDTDYGAEARGRTVSTHILGVGIVLVGVLLLAVGLIMGLEFPKYVRDHIKENQCVVRPDQSSYESWIKGTQWNRKVRAYFWTLENSEEFLYRGGKPKFVERGPYVYTDHEFKDDVSFAITEVSYVIRHEHEFDVEATASECRNCGENDLLTIINPWHLQIVGQAGGEQYLTWANIPVYVFQSLSRAGLVYTDDDLVTYNTNATILGSFTSGSSVPPFLSQFSFGAWYQNWTGDRHKATLDAERNGQSLTLSEVTALYKVISNVTLLGGVSLSTPNVTLQTTCEQWALNVCLNSLFKVKNIGVQECGVIYLFQKCHDVNVTSVERDILTRTFCPPGGDACLNLTGSSDAILPSYKHVLYQFLLHLSEIVFNRLHSSWDLDLVITRNQSELALGYDVKGDDVIGGFKVPGLLQPKWKEQLSGQYAQWTVLTCLNGRDMNNNMVVEEYKNSWATPPQLLKKSSLQPSLTSFTDFVTSCPVLRACASCSSPPPTVEMFMEDLVRPVQFLRDVSSAISGVDVYKYTMDTGDFSNSDVYLVSEGLQNMTGITGYFSWASQPHNVGSSTGHLAMDISQNPTPSYIVVEPVTGRVWQRSIKLQWNVGISNQTAHASWRNVSVTELPLPVFWFERLAEIDDGEIEGYKHLPPPQKALPLVTRKSSMPTQPPCQCHERLFYEYGETIGYESRTMEFKCANWNMHYEENIDLVGKYVCAFLNGGGGIMYLGVSDDGQIKGIKCQEDQFLLFQRAISLVPNHIEPPITKDCFVINKIKVRPKQEKKDDKKDKSTKEKEEPPQKIPANLCVMEVCIKPIKPVGEHDTPYLYKGRAYWRREASTHQINQY